MGELIFFRTFVLRIIVFFYNVNRLIAHRNRYSFGKLSSPKPKNCMKGDENPSKGYTGMSDGIGPIAAMVAFNGSF